LYYFVGADKMSSYALRILFTSSKSYVHAQILIKSKENNPNKMTLAVLKKLINFSDPEENGCL
jgi:hypothetical protein